MKPGAERNVEEHGLSAATRWAVITACLVLTACASGEPRCEGTLQPINPARTVPDTARPGADRGE